jgi:hypothetical protein
VEAMMLRQHGKPSRNFRIHPSKVFYYSRSVDDLTDEEMITLLEWLGEKSTGAVATRDVHESLEARGIAQILG